MLLILVSIWVFKKFKELAISKGYAEEAKKWGWKGVGVYAVIGFGLQIVIGLMAGLGMIDIDVEATGVSLVIGLICWGIGGIAAYILYQRFEAKENNRPRISDFGKDEDQLNQSDLEV